MNWESLAAFAGVLAMLALVPGPSDLLVVGCAIHRGLRSAWIMIGGMLFADVILIGVVVLGISTLLELFDQLALWLEFGSGVVLIVFGVSLLMYRGSEVRFVSRKSHWSNSSFAAGFLITLLDPKALAFYFGLLPLCMDMKQVNLLDVVLLFGMVTIVVCVIKGLYAWSAVRGLSIISSLKARRSIHYLAGGALVVMGSIMIVR